MERQRILLSIPYCVLCYPQNFANLTHRKLFGKKSKKHVIQPGPYTAPGSHAFTTLFPSTDLKLYIEKYRFIRSIMYYVL